MFTLGRFRKIKDSSALKQPEEITIKKYKEGNKPELKSE